VFHYHTASSCIGDPDYYTKNPGPLREGDVKDTITAGFKVTPYRSTLGIAKDGRPVYTPLHSGGKSYTDCEVDICNGMIIGGSYAYVSTLFHPYIIGCFGPGSSDVKMYQQCSKNPRLCGVEMGATKLSLASSFAALAYLLSY